MGTAGLTEISHFGLPDGSLDTGSPTEPFDWSQAPALPEAAAKEGEAWAAVPEELVACQRDAAAAPLKATPSRSG